MPRRGKQLFADHWAVSWDKAEERKANGGGGSSGGSEDAPKKRQEEQETQDKGQAAGDLGSRSSKPRKNEPEDRSVYVDYSHKKNVLAWSARPRGQRYWTHFTTIDGVLIYRGPTPLHRRTWEQEHYIGPDPYCVAVPSTNDDVELSDAPLMPMPSSGTQDALWADMEDDGDGGVTSCGCR